MLSASRYNLALTLKESNPRFRDLRQGECATKAFPLQFPGHYQLNLGCLICAQQATNGCLSSIHGKALSGKLFHEGSFFWNDK